MPHHTHEHFLRRISKMRIDPVASDRIIKPPSLTGGSNLTPAVRPGGNLPVKYNPGVNWRWGNRHQGPPSRVLDPTKHSRRANWLRRLGYLRHTGKLAGSTAWWTGYGLAIAGGTELLWYLGNKLFSPGDPNLDDEYKPTGDEIKDYSNVKLDKDTLNMLKNIKFDSNKKMSLGGMTKEYKGGGLINKYK